jgi:ABC-2 type transport system ATP-binding protein
VLAELAELPAVERVEQLPSEVEGAHGPPADLRVRLYVSGEAPLLVAPAASLLARHGRTLADVKLGIPTLEDIFIELTGRTLR